eukprot:PhM_4_TR13803/c0_g1_i1/m.70673
MGIKGFWSRVVSSALPYIAVQNKFSENNSATGTTIVVDASSFQVAFGTFLYTSDCPRHDKFKAPFPDADALGGEPWYFELMLGRFLDVMKKCGVRFVFVCEGTRGSFPFPAEKMACLKQREEQRLDNTFDMQQYFDHKRNDKVIGYNVCAYGIQVIENVVVNKDGDACGYHQFMTVREEFDTAVVSIVKNCQFPGAVYVLTADSDMLVLPDLNVMPLQEFPFAAILKTAPTNNKSKQQQQHALQFSILSIETKKLLSYFNASSMFTLQIAAGMFLGNDFAPPCTAITLKHGYFVFADYVKHAEHEVKKRQEMLKDKKTPPKLPVSVDFYVHASKVRPVIRGCELEPGWPVHSAVLAIKRGSLPKPPMNAAGRRLMLATARLLDVNTITFFVNEAETLSEVPTDAACGYTLSALHAQDSAARLKFLLSVCGLSDGSFPPSGVLNPLLFGAVCAYATTTTSSSMIEVRALVHMVCALQHKKGLQHIRSAMAPLITRDPLTVVVRPTSDMASVADNYNDTVGWVRNLAHVLKLHDVVPSAHACYSPTLLVSMLHQLRRGEKDNLFVVPFECDEVDDAIVAICRQIEMFVDEVVGE